MLREFGFDLTPADRPSLDLLLVPARPGEQFGVSAANTIPSLEEAGATTSQTDNFLEHYLLG